MKKNGGAGKMVWQHLLEGRHLLQMKWYVILNTCLPVSLKIKTLLIHCIYLMYLQGTMETVRVVSMDKDFHVECYKCVVSTVCYKCRSQLL